MTIAKNIALFGPYSQKKRIQKQFKKPSLAKQSFAKECDINHIMSRFQKDGLVTHLNKNQEQYGFAPAIEFREALDLVAKSRELFAGLPSTIRTRFNNNPAEFLEFCENPDNRSEMAVLGLIEKPDTGYRETADRPTDSESAPQAPNPGTDPAPPTAKPTAAS